MELTEHYETLKLKVKDRKESFDRFLRLLEGETTWLTSPAERNHMQHLRMDYQGHELPLSHDSKVDGNSI